MNDTAFKYNESVHVKKQSGESYCLNKSDENYFKTNMMRVKFSTNMIGVIV